MKFVDKILPMSLSNGEGEPFDVIFLSNRYVIVIDKEAIRIFDTIEGFLDGSEAPIKVIMFKPSNNEKKTLLN
jgi:hypothetical protein